MTAPLNVLLDTDRIRSNLAAAGDTVTAEELAAYLMECGFLDRGDGWYTCEAISLESLDKSEILDIRHQ